MILITSARGIVMIYRFPKVKLDCSSDAPLKDRLACPARRDGHCAKPVIAELRHLNTSCSFLRLSSAIAGRSGEALTDL